MVTIFEFIVHLFDFFFFFKQKTAYEMRISDWSSDVCSSDLRKRVERDLDAWFADLRPFERAILLYLKLLRGSVPAEPLTARSGIYLHTPAGPCLLVRVLVPVAHSVYPEIRAGRHRFTVRFMAMRELSASPTTSPKSARRRVGQAGGN